MLVWSKTSALPCIGILPTVVLVEVLERGVEVLFPVHSVHVHRRGDELLVVNQSIAICISLEKFEVQMNFDEKYVVQWNPCY